MFSGLWIRDLGNLLFPRICYACGETLTRQEEVICSYCRFKLPKTNFHRHTDNPVEKIFWGRVYLRSASSFLFFNKGGNVQKLIHLLKYKGKKQVGFFLGKLFGMDLLDSDDFKNIDFIIPVPLHPKKQHKRGFNQSTVIADGIGRSLRKPVVDDNLIRLVNTASQTKKTRYSRWENVKDVFAVSNPENLTGKHILLVDDVLTTGATLEACAQKILEVEGTEVSVATIAYAQG